MRSEIESKLERLHARPDDGDARRVAHRDELEPDVLTRFESRRAQPQRRRGSRRWWLGATATAAVAVAACQLPAEYELDVGERLAISVGADRMDQLDFMAISEYVEANYELDEMRVRVEVEQQDDGQPTATIQLDMVGAGIDADEIWVDLETAFPSLEGGRIEAESLDATMHGTLGGRLSGGLVDRIIDEHGVEEAKRRILEELAAQGLEGKADIDVIDEHTPGGEHRREVRVRVEAQGEHEGGGEQP